MEFKIQDLAWNTFKQTGDINTFMELKLIDNMINNISDNKIKNLDGNNQIEGIGKIN